MIDNKTSASGPSLGVAALAVALVGLFVLAYGLLVAPSTLLGGAWIAAIGLSLVLAGLFTTGGRATASASRLRTGAGSR